MAINFTLRYPEMVDALIPVAMGLSGFEPEGKEEKEQEHAHWNAVGEALKQQNIDRAVELTLHKWTDGPARSADHVDPAVRQRVGL